MQTKRPFMRFSTGVDWRHLHLVSERKFPEIYGVYFTGSYSQDYSAVRHSLFYYLLLVIEVKLGKLDHKRLYNTQ